MTTCGVSSKVLYSWAVGERVGALAEHVASCANCQASLQRLDRGLEELKESAPPPMTPFAAERMVARALASSDEDAPRRAFRRSVLGWGGAFAVAGVSLVLAVVLRDPAALPDHATTLVAGAVTSEDDGRPRSGSLPNDALLVSGDAPTTIRLDDDSRIELGPGTRFRLVQAGTRFELLEGRVTLTVRPRAKRPLSVVTEEATARVVGTRFTVARVTAPRPRTTVSVEEGRVEVTDSSGAQSLDSGQSKTSEAGGPPPPQPEPQLQPQPQPQKVPHAHKSPARRVPTAAMARERLNAGDYGGVHLVAREVRELGQQAALEAELSMLEAEAYLAEGQPGNALDSYLTVAHRFSSHPLAEQALFAAVQLALDYRPGLTQNLTSEYLRRYPGGRYRKDVERMLGDR